MKLRPYQSDLINKIKSELLKGKKSVCAVLGCGGGKSVIQGCIAKSATDKGNRVLFLVHRRELCEQISNTFKAVGVDMDKCDIQMVQTACRRLNKMPDYQLIITDECHHANAESYKKIYRHYENVLRVGFTATPCRLGQGGLGEIFDSLVEGVSTKWLIDNKYLAPYEYYSIKLADADGIHTKRGEFVASEVSELMEKQNIYGSTIDTYRQYADGKKTIVYCASIKASKETAAEFKKNGYRAEHIDGMTSDTERKMIIDNFRKGEIDILSNVDLFGEGFDVPDCECVILLRPTMSLTLHIQQSMRSMRYKNGKTAIIIDHVGNVYRHGLPDDSREWSLEGKKNKAKSTVTIKQCPVCFKCLPSNAQKCECGYVFQAEIKPEKEVISAELQKISADDLQYNDYKKCKSFDELEFFRKLKKYKFLWTLRKCIELNIPYPKKYAKMVRRFIE